MKIGIAQANMLTAVQCQELHRLGYDPEDLVEGAAAGGTAGHVNVKNPTNLVAYLEDFANIATRSKYGTWRAAFVAVPNHTIAGAGGADAYIIGNAVGFVRADLNNAQAADQTTIDK